MVHVNERTLRMNSWCGFMKINSLLEFMQMNSPWTEILVGVSRKWTHPCPR